jgi:3-hydroxyacyl-CoA dehydrogenase
MNRIKPRRLVQALTYQSFQYSASLLPEVADSPKPIDDAIRWGFGHEAGPFETWDMLGVKETVKRMKAAGYPAPKWVDAMLKSGIESFYQYKNGDKIGVYDVNKEKVCSHRETRRRHPAQRPQGHQRECRRNLYDIGDGVACVDFHTKMNALDDDIFAIVNEAL